MQYIPTKQDLWFLPLGGSGEIGMNLNLFGHDGAWLMVDCGITFHDRLGIEVITPDPSFIVPYQKHLKALVLTHAHEDHIGAVPYLWPILRCPIYATPFTAEVVHQKISEYNWAEEVQIIEVPLKGTVDIKPFSVEFITLTHSIPEPNALAIITKLGTIVHTGDWKIDNNPMVGEQLDHSRLSALGDAGVLAMVCDSTNAFSEGYAGSESEVRQELTDLIGKYSKKRITVACFASNIARVESVALAAQAHGRKIALLGRSLQKMTQAAKVCGYLKHVSDFIAPEKAASMPNEKVLFITTGSQGEPRAALTRISNNQHSDVEFNDKDLIIFSSRVIPGNERAISAMQNRLITSGATVITSHEEDIHVSGHPTRGDLRQMYSWVRPKILIPVHGEARHMKAQAQLAHDCGIIESVVPSNGALIQINKNNAKIIDRVHSGRWGLDGRRMLPMESQVFKERAKISVDGVVFVTLMQDKKKKLYDTANVSFMGIVELGKEMDNLIKDLQKRIGEILEEKFNSLKSRDDTLIQSIRQAINKKYGKKPQIVIHGVDY